MQVIPTATNLAEIQTFPHKICTVHACTCVKPANIQGFNKTYNNPEYISTKLANYDVTKVAEIQT